MIHRRSVLAGAAVLAALSAAPAAAQTKTEISLSRQLGILYLPTHVIEKRKLIESEAQKLGVSGVTTSWVSFSSSSAQQDALISGNVDIINTGTGPLLLMWDRTRGAVKGIVASSAQPNLLVSRDPRIKTLADFQQGDKIAVPTVKVSTQAILLQMAAAKMFGPDKWNHFDTLTVQMGHADALVAMRNAGHEIKNHFGAPPFQHYALKDVPGAHVVTTSAEIIGGPLSQGQFFTTTKFADANPKIIQAVRNAAAEAKAFIENNPKEAVDIYKEVTSDKTPAEDLLALLAQPGMSEWSLQPQGTMTFAAHLHMTGALKTMPASWKDYYLPVAHDLAGN